MTILGSSSDLRKALEVETQRWAALGAAAPLESPVTADATGGDPFELDEDF